MKDNMIFRMMEDGGFVAGDKGTEMTSYAYPTSPYAVVAKKYPLRVAEDMLKAESVWMRKLPVVQEYDRKNWQLLANADKQSDPSQPAEGLISPVWCYLCSRPAAHCFGHTDEEIVKHKYPDADYHEESKWWESGVWRKGIVPILLGKTWQAAREAISKPEGTICPNCLKPELACTCTTTCTK